jgi:hypothetical protein
MCEENKRAFVSMPPPLKISFIPILNAQLMRYWTAAYLDDVALDGVWYGNLQGCPYGGANKHHIAFGGLCIVASNISYPWILTVFA